MGRQADSSDTNPFSGDQVAGNDLVGRDAERVELESRVTAVAKHESANLVLAGRHGTGKTTLLNWTTDVAATHSSLLPVFLDATALRGAGLTRSVGLSIVNGTRDGRALFPELAQKWIDCTSPFQYRPETVSPGAALGHDFKVLALALHGEQIEGVVLCLDEMQDADAPTVNVLKQALSEPGSLSTLMITTIRLLPADEPRDVISTLAKGNVGLGQWLGPVLPVGPFANLQEARLALTRRLARCRRSFPDAVVNSIVQGSTLVPRDVMNLAEDAYQSARSRASEAADEYDVFVALRNRDPSAVMLAEQAASRFGDTEIRVLRSLCQNPRKLRSGDDIARSFGLDPPVDWVSATLARLSERASLDRVYSFQHGKAELTDPHFAIALRLILEGKTSAP